MNEKTWERHCYIMDLFDSDQYITERQKEYQELWDHVFAYIKTQPEDIQSMLITFVTLSGLIYSYPFSLACQHLRLPVDVKNTEKRSNNQEIATSGLRPSSQ